MKTHEVEDRILEERATAVVRDKVRVVDIPHFLGTAYCEIAEFVAGKGIALAGPPYARYRLIEGDEFEVEAGFPVERPLAEVAGHVVAGTLPGGPAGVLWYTGSYDEMEPAYVAMSNWLTDNGYEQAGPPWEVYFSDPAVEPDPSTWSTEIVQPYTS